MSTTDLGQVSGDAAEIYENFFVPALFREWTKPVLDAARVNIGHRVLDVACGTGVVARAARTRVGSGGRVVGLDCNPGMLAIARQREPDIEWIAGRAESLPQRDASWDAVVCQFGLMFFEDRAAALREMVRVLRPGGHLAVAVWDGLGSTPGYAALVAMLERLFGRAAADALRAPFCLGDVGELGAIFRAAGCGEVEITTREGTARFPSLRDWVYTNVRGWTFSGLVDDAGMDRLLAATEREFGRFVQADGSVVFASPAHIVVVAKP